MNGSFYIQLTIILFTCIICSFQDLKSTKVNKFIILGASFLELLLHAIQELKSLPIFLVTGILCAAVYFLVRVLSKKKLGLADVYFGFFQGIFLLPVYIPVCIFLSSLAGILGGVTFFRHKKIPFIPFMSFGLAVTFVIQFFNLF